MGGKKYKGEINDNYDDSAAHPVEVQLDLRQQLIDEQIVMGFALNKKTKCIILQLNHRYEKKSVVCTVYRDWLKTIDKFSGQAKRKGVFDNHVLMLTDTLDDNHEKIMDCIVDSQSMDSILDKHDEMALEVLKDNIVESFIDETKTPYCAITINDHVETMPIESRTFEDFVGSKYYDVSKHILSKEEISKLQSILRFEAQHNESGIDDQVRTLHVRVAALVEFENNVETNTIYYDLCNKNWEIVKINRDGWSIENHNSPILFKRYSINNPQVYPSREYPVDIMDKFIAITNVKNDEDNKLLIEVYLIALIMLEKLPKPLLLPHGIKGSAKSTLQELIKLIVDPSAALTTAFPKNIEELIQALAHSFLVVFDNVSKISELTSDQLCRAVTGAGFTKRGLYTNDEDFIYNMKRAVGYNGINIVATKSDLLDRMLTIHLSPINKKQRKKLSSVQKEFHNILPQLLGFIFDTVVKVLNRLGEVKMEELPRMADFAEIGELIARCLGYPEGRFTEVYNRNIGFNNEEAVNSSPVATAIISLMNSQAIWSGKSHTLLLKLNDLVIHKQELSGLTKHPDWPRCARSMSERINEITANMNEIGIIIEKVYDKHTKSDTITIVNNDYTPGDETKIEGDNKQ